MLSVTSAVVVCGRRYLARLTTASTIWLAATLILFAGCSLIEPETVEIATVNGQVLMDDKPLADAKVLFVPLNKDLGNRFATSQAVTDSEGNFELRLSDNRPGAYVGRHYVLISKSDDRPKKRAVDLDTFFDIDSPMLLEINSGDVDEPNDEVPRYYNVETELQFEVRLGQNNMARFELSSVDPMLK